MEKRKKQKEDMMSMQKSFIAKLDKVDVIYHTFVETCKLAVVSVLGSFKKFLMKYVQEEKIPAFYYKI